MVAAAETIVMIEHICTHPEEILMDELQQAQRHHFTKDGALVCTVGEIAAWPGASNVIPGEVCLCTSMHA
jgi:allantoate deiminase